MAHTPELRHLRSIEGEVWVRLKEFHQKLEPDQYMDAWKAGDRFVSLLSGRLENPIS